jgi:serine/threonine protein kinase
LYEGSYGVVRLATAFGSNEQLAIKVVHKTLLDEATLLRARREGAILGLLQFPFIIKLVAAIETLALLAIATEYCAGGDLCEYVQAQGFLVEDEAKHYFVQLVSALVYLHAKNILHRDVKLTNLTLLERKSDWRDHEIRLIDFGLASHDPSKDRIHSTFCGTPAFAAPEMLLSNSYVGGGVDVWSCGVVLFYMLTGGAPFADVARYVNGLPGLSLLTGLQALLASLWTWGDS